AAELRRLEAIVADEFRRLGITFTVYSENEGIERTWPMDLFPRLIGAAEWRHIERGLAQRVTALNRFLEDLYVGEQAVVADGVIPGWLVTSSPGFERSASGILVPFGAHCMIAGIDLVRGADGDYAVLEDNLRNPSGISYVIENRAAMAKAFPNLFADHTVQPVEQYGRLLRSTLESVAPPTVSDRPTIVILTPGVHNSAYFEHAFLARSMGVELVEGQDLVVDDQVVYARTIGGLLPVDVIYRRIDDAFLDPIAFRTDSALGVPGLLGAVRAGAVTICNAIGNGVADDKAIYPYVPALIRYYLDEEPVIPNVATYVMWDDDQRADVLGRLDELVVKPVAESGGYGIVIGPHATEAELDAARAGIEADPRKWIVQDVVDLSSLASLSDDHLEPRHLDLRPFVLTGEKTRVFPGGLTRVAMRRGSLIVNSSQGGGSKDTWVLANGQGDR
ncbi:MAG: circularly permuted type 2 ATP-grasp protein, partial [Acidimicrobiia bacterium]|nr:circularly permuted type 2 ATP-grasp protein [Acidimicrobiia bacterium]